MKGQRLDVVYSIGDISILDAWLIIFEFILGVGIRENVEASVYGKSVKLNNVYNYLKKYKKTHFRIIVGDLSFGYCAVTAWRHVLIDVENGGEATHFNLAKLVECFLVKKTCIQAWVSDIEYHFWQNAADPMEYECYNKSYDNLPMKSNGLPPPLEKMVIDTSKNPGRRIIKMGYVEAIGSTMWLGDEFWERTGTDKVGVANVYLGKSEPIKADILKISLLDEVFTSSSNADEQHELRRIIYGLPY